jgi:hypothetical protein
VEVSIRDYPLQWSVVWKDVLGVALGDSFTINRLMTGYEDCCLAPPSLQAHRARLTTQILRHLSYCFALRLPFHSPFHPPLRSLIYRQA